MWNQRSEKDIERTNKIFAELGFEPPGAPVGFANPGEEAKIQYEMENGEEAGERGELKRCPVSEKVCFPSQATAERAGKRRERTSSTGFIRVYQCPDCHSWHLTSRKPRKKN